MILVKIDAKDRLDQFNVIIVPVQRSASWYRYNSVDEFIDDNIDDDSWGDNEMYTFQRDASGVIYVDSSFGLMTMEQAFEDELLDVDDERLTKGLDAVIKSTALCYAVKSRGWDGTDWDFFTNEDEAKDYHLRELYSAATSDFNADYVLEDVGDVIRLFGKRLTRPSLLSGVARECARIIANHYAISKEIAYYLLERATRCGNNIYSLVN